MIISNDERARLVTAPDKELAREEKQAQKQAEKTQKIKEREEKRQRRDEEKLEQKQARDAVRLLEKASKVTKKRKQPHALAAGMGDLLAAGQQDSDDDDDNDDEDDDAADAGDDANDVAVTNTAYRGDFDGGAKTVSGFMSFANASTSAPQFPSAAAASVPTAGDSLTRADELSKMLESVLMNRPAQSAPTQQPAAQSAAAALAGLAPTWPPQQPAEAQASGSQEGQLQAMLTSVFEDADMNLVSAVQHQRIRQFLGGNRTNPDPSSPVHSIVLRKSIKDDQEVTLFVELNYETATWRKVSRRKRLAGPTPTPMAQ